MKNPQLVRLNIPFCLLISRLGCNRKGLKRHQEIKVKYDMKIFCFVLGIIRFRDSLNAKAIVVEEPLYYDQVY